MATSFLRKLFHREGRRGVPMPRTRTDEGTDGEDLNSQHTPSSSQDSPTTGGSSLFAFVDLKDPFLAGEIAGEELPGPILSIMSARKFCSLFLFFTPHTRENAVATANEVTRRYADCRVTAYELAVSDPKDY